MANNLTLTKNVPRPNYNTTVGSPLRVITNHYKVLQLPTATIQQWAVEFVTDKPPPTSKAALMRRNNGLWNSEAVQSEFGGNLVIYNGGGIAYTCQKLPFEQLSKVIDEKKGSKIRMAKTITINPEPLKQLLLKKYAYDENVAQVITFLDALISDHPRRSFSTVFGTSQFFKSNKDSPAAQAQNVFDLERNVELWRGIFQSARPGPGYMTINVDVAHTAFYKPGITIVDLLWGNLQLGGPEGLRKLGDDPRRRREAMKLLQGLGVYTSHTARRDKSTRPEKIFSILWSQTALTYKFEKDEKMITVSQYFKQAYNITLQYPSLPLLEMNGGKSRLPMEVCRVASGQKFPNALLSGHQTAAIVKQAARPPSDRLTCIRDNVKSLNWAEDPSLKQFGLKIAKDPIEANARVLECPAIAYGNSQSVKPTDGKWNASGKKLYKGMVVESWGILKLFQSRDDGRVFVQEFVRSGTQSGVQFKAKDPVIEAGNPAGDLERVLNDFCKKIQAHFRIRPQILLIILPDRYEQLYGVVKLVCDTKLGVASQCIAGKNFSKANRQYCANLWLKVNAKLGGQNTQLARNPFTEATLLLGADVSHPPAGALAGDSPSIASLVSSTDVCGSRFIGQAAAQTARQEIISELERLTKNAIGQFGTYPGGRTQKASVPKSIIYFRDGVGENQFDEIREKELAAIKAACKTINPMPKITIIICQKRHHTRFFAKGGSKAGNGILRFILELCRPDILVKPGTVVDNDITHPVDFDFFLVPHWSFKGTARPTHYQVIYDENRFKAETLQKMTNDLCHAYTRSTTAVSLVPAAYYAHLVGTRVKAYCGGGSDAGSTAADVDIRNLLPSLHANLRCSMWYI